MKDNTNALKCPFSREECFHEPCAAAVEKTCLLASYVQERVSAMRTKREQRNAEYLAAANKIRNSASITGDSLVDYVEGLALQEAQQKTLIDLILNYAQELGHYSYTIAFENAWGERKKSEKRLEKLRAANQSLNFPMQATGDPGVLDDDGLPF